MSSAPEEAAAEEAPAAAKPNAVAAAFARGIAVLNGALQGMRQRSGEPVPDVGSEGEATDVSATKGPSALLRMGLASALALLLGVALGMYFTYSLFSEKLDRQEAQIAAQIKRLNSVEPEKERSKKSETECLDTLAETQKKLFETQRSLAKATSWRMSRCDENDTACLAKYAPGGSGAVPSAAPRRPAAERAAAERAAASQQSGTCDISSSNPQESLARCLGAYNR